MNHPVLGDLKLDFCDKNNKAVDTVLFAGENGTGKTIILEYLYNICDSHGRIMPYLKELEIEQDGKIQNFSFLKQEHFNTDFTDENGKVILWGRIARTFIPSAILSSTEINFNTKGIDSIKSLDLDMNSENSKTDIEMAKQIEQLIVDIYNADSSIIRDRLMKDRVVRLKDVEKDLRMNRFANAFNKMFDNIKFDSIKNRNNKKIIYFKKNNQLIPINLLSSGEKQIIYRGCFLLKDKEALKGALVLIDEPEISMHPRWQKRIMNYYKNIFTDKKGKQTSQMFAVTHSPFIIHNDSRRNDKVIVLYRDENELIQVSDKAEYYKAESVEVIEDSFHIEDFQNEESCVFVEGETDEKYLKKTIEVFGLDVPFDIKWVGYVDEKGKIRNSGIDAVKRAFNFLSSRYLEKINVCLVDCDAKCDKKIENNTVLMKIPFYSNSQHVNVGIENALVLEDLNMDDFHKDNINYTKTGSKSNNPILEKKKLCDYICNLDDNSLRIVLKNLKELIEEIKNEYY